MSKVDWCLNRAVRTVSMFPVVFCLALVGWSYYGFAISLCGYLIWHDSATQGILYLFVYHPVLILFVTSFIRCVLMHPGRPPNLMPIKDDEYREGDETVVESALIDAVNGQVSRSVDTGMELGHRVIDYRSHSRTSSNAEDDDINDDGTARVDSTRSINESRVPLITTTSALNTTSVDSTLISSSGNRQALNGVITVKEDGQPRFCRKCQLNKPDRTHHCSVCGECILKMDHHCPWINNCVGHRNQKFFYLFIFWGAIYTSFVGLASIPPVYNVLINDNGLLVLNIHWLFVVLCGCIFGLCLMGLTGYHTYLLLTNQTTIETFQRNRYRRLGGTIHHNHCNRLNLFDLGWRDNICQVLGPVPLLWLVPVQNTPGDGCVFKLNERAYEAVSIHEMLV